MKKLLSVAVAFVCAISCLSITAFAKPSHKPNLCAYFGEDGVYEISETQLQEMIITDNPEEVVVKYDLTPVPYNVDTRSNETEINKTVQPSKQKTTGSWDIDSDTILAGYTVTYSQPNGRNFVIDSGEELIFSMYLEEVCSVTLGVKGSRNLSHSWNFDPADAGGVTIYVPYKGSYKCYINNSGSDDFNTQGGGIAIYEV